MYNFLCLLKLKKYNPIFLKPNILQTNKRYKRNMFSVEIMLPQPMKLIESETRYFMVKNHLS